MKLEIDDKEAKSILLEWAVQKWPGAFNDVEVDAKYGSFRSVTFSKVEPEEPEAKAE